ncbi:MAG TPA: SRPBCC family protein [Nitrolancea sp.]|jgi:uncharacterized protein YndB with AHSA1/START domain|nr:SRPBCC family protein [Nitrolancea sp.]
MPEVVRSIEIQAPPSAVWHWLATPEALRRWISPNLEIDLRVGGTYRLLNPGEQTWISGTVLEMVPEGSLILSWFEEGGDWVYPARLVVTLTPTSSGTRVTLAHDGFAGIGKPSWPETVQAYERGADRHELLQRLSELAVAVSV